MSLLSRMNRYFVREGEIEACFAGKVHVVLSFVRSSPSATLSLFAVPQIPWVNIVPQKSKSGWIFLPENLNFTVYHSKIKECFSLYIMRLAARVLVRYSRDTTYSDTHAGFVCKWSFARIEFLLPGLAYSVFSMGL